jgi:hypothetical protein
MFINTRMRAGEGMKGPLAPLLIEKARRWSTIWNKGRKISSKGFKEPQFRSVVYKEEERKKERLGYRAVG